MVCGPRVGPGRLGPRGHDRDRRVVSPRCPPAGARAVARGTGVEADDTAPQVPSAPQEPSDDSRGPVRALLIAWAVQEDRGAEMPRLRRALTGTSPRGISRWLVTRLGLDTLRQQVQGTWVPYTAPSVPAPLTALCLESSAAATPARNGETLLAGAPPPATVLPRRGRGIMGEDLEKDP